MSSSTATVFFLSLAGFLAFDFDIFKPFAPGRQMIVLVGVTLLSMAFIIASGQGQLLGLPDWFKYPGWVLTILGGGLLIYSVFIEIPLTQRRRQTHSPASSATSALVQTGTYALCRHPGFWWLILLLTGQIMVRQNAGMVQLAFIWIVLDLTLIVIQDRHIFPRRFPDYSDYQASTPFLIPAFNQDTLRRLFSTEHPT